MGRVSFKNHLKASGRKENKSLILSQSCEIIGLPAQKSLLSQRIWYPCGQKKRKVHENFTFFKDKLDNSESEYTEIKALSITNDNVLQQ